MRMWQVVIGAIFFFSLAIAEEKKIDYKAPVVGGGIFSEKLGMMDKEREEYAVKASPESLTQARRLLALSLHLSSRNRKAVVMNYQLEKGILPQKVDGDYSSEVLARLLLTRGQLLIKQPAEEDVLLGRCFIEVAAEMDARNDDAVYASELLRMDNKKINWSIFTDFKVQKEEIPLSVEGRKDQKP